MLLAIILLVLFGTTYLLPDTVTVEANKQVSNNISRYHVQCNISLTAINTLASYIQNYCNVIISSSASGGTNCPTLQSCHNTQVNTQ